MGTNDENNSDNGGDGSQETRPGLPEVAVTYGRRLGGGAHGIVWEATDVLLKRTMAVKFLTGTDEAYDIDALLRDAQTLAKLSHPNLVTAYGVAALRHPETRFLAPAVMLEVLNGEPLQKWWGVEHPREESIRVAIELIQGIKALHDGGLHHGDLHSENVMVLGGGATKVIDWRHQDTFLARSTASRTSVLEVDVRRALGLILDLFERQGLRTEAQQLRDILDLNVALALLEAFRTGSSHKPTRSSPRRRSLLVFAVLVIVIGVAVAVIKRDATQSVAYATIVPQPQVRDLELVIRNEADVPLTDVAVKVTCFTCARMGAEPEIHVGTIPPRGIRQLAPSFVPQTGPGGIASYQFVVSHAHGQTVEAMQLRHGRNLTWAYKLSVMTQPPTTERASVAKTLVERGWSDDRTPNAHHVPIQLLRASMHALRRTKSIVVAGVRKSPIC